jgi:phage terminase large subunit-like protein
MSIGISSPDSQANLEDWFIKAITDELTADMPKPSLDQEPTESEPTSPTFSPQPGPQTEYFKTTADIAVYGGAAGGGKTWSLLVDPLRYMHVAGFGGIIFRRKFTEVTNQGGLWDESMGVYPQFGAKPVGHQWRWENGNKLAFAHLIHEETKLAYQGAQIPFIGFDELTHFSETQFWYLLSRSRSVCGVTPYVRCTCNADSGSWVANFIDWYWDAETGYAIPERGGVIRYLIRIGQDIVWGNSREELEIEYAEWLAEQRVHAAGFDPIKSFTFIPAKVYDNKILLDRNPEYLANLHMQLPVERERLLHGNWKVSPTAGDVFDRDWFEIVDEAPIGGYAVRFWDLAATLKKMEDKGDGPSFTAGVLMRRVDDVYYIEDVINVRLGPPEVDRIVDETALDDLRWALEAECHYITRWEREPGSASIRETYRKRSELSRKGVDGDGVPPQGEKIQRALPLGVDAQQGRVKIVRGAWNDKFLTQLHNQPDYPHKDMMDAASGAHFIVRRMGKYTALKM